jgi:hypothetical protein
LAISSTFLRREDYFGKICSSDADTEGSIGFGSNSTLRLLR